MPHNCEEIYVINPTLGPVLSFVEVDDDVLFHPGTQTTCVEGTQIDYQCIYRGSKTSFT